MARKAQVSVEYLMNYAIAIIIIVIALAGLNYLGIFRILGSPPEVCLFQQGMDCGGSPLLPQSGKLQLNGVNEQGDTIVITGVMCSAEPVNPATGLPKDMWSYSFDVPKDREWENPADSVYPSTVENGKNFDVKVDCYKPDGKDTETLAQGEGYSGLVYVQYHKASSGPAFSHVILANIQTPVQPATPCPSACKCGCDEAPTCKVCPPCPYAVCQGCCTNPPTCDSIPTCVPACKIGEKCMFSRTISVDGKCTVNRWCEVVLVTCRDCSKCRTAASKLLCLLGINCKCTWIALP